MDENSRNVLSWKFSNSPDTEFCLEAMELALSSAAGRRSSTPIKDAVNLNRLHGPVAVGGDQDQMLRKEALLGQHPGGELVENGQVRGRLSTGLQR